MGQQNLLNLDARLFNGICNSFKITARIDHSALLRIIIKNDGTILLKRCDRNDEDFELGHASK
jgi:hypothetical protein